MLSSLLVRLSAAIVNLPKQGIGSPHQVGSTSPGALRISKFEVNEHVLLATLPAHLIWGLWGADTSQTESLFTDVFLV